MPWLAGKALRRGGTLRPARKRRGPERDGKASQEETGPRTARLDSAGPPVTSTGPLSTYAPTCLRITKRAAPMPSRQASKTPPGSLEPVKGSFGPPFARGLSFTGFSGLSDGAYA